MTTLYTANSGSLVQVQQGKDRAIFKPSHQACKETPVAPNYVYVQRTTSLPSAWSGSETFTDFELPQSLGVVDQLIVRFQVAVSTSSVVLPPTAFWVSRLEEYIGQDLLATTYANEQYNEGVGFLDATQLEQMATAMNLAGGSATSTYGNGTIPTGTSYYYLPLAASAFNTMNPCVAGFNAKLRVRIYFPSSIIASGSGTISLTDCYLIARELKNPNLEAVVRAHQHGVVDYNVIVRERQLDQTTLTSGTTTPLYLRSFKNDSAGLLVYITAQSPSNADLYKRYSVQDVQLLDQVNNRLTEILRQDFNAPFMWTDAVESAYTTALGVGDEGSSATSQYNHIMVLPFSADFRKTATTGCDFGKYPLSTLEKLQITPDPNTSSGTGVGAMSVFTISYSYGHVVVKDGKHFIQMTSTSGR
jgi:hypothetical protein